MNCPVCKTSTLAAHELSANLTSQKCATCGGQWISSFEFWKWLEGDRIHTQETPAACDLSAVSNETVSAKICPECGHFLSKFKVGHSLGFSLDRCGNCGGTWFDRNEWEILQSSELRSQIHLIFSAAWQQQVQNADRARHLQELLTDKIGENDFVEIKRIKEWLDQHPHRQSLLAFLNSDAF